MRSKYTFAITLIALFLVIVLTVPVHSIRRLIYPSAYAAQYTMYESVGRIAHRAPRVLLSAAHDALGVFQNRVSYYNVPGPPAQIYDSGTQGMNRHRSISTTCTVTTTADAGSGSLRQCLVNAIPNDTINFDPQTFPQVAPATIALSSALPTIAADGLTIDGSNAGVILDGSGLATGSGLAVSGADGVRIRGLHILNFPNDGLQLIAGTTNATVGGNTASTRNIISGNTGAGIAVLHSGTAGNQVLGNYIGTDATGVTQVGNRWGVVLAFGARNNTIGGNMAGAGNVISGNEFGVQIQDASTTGNQAVGNYIGTGATGITPLGNGTGVVILSGAQGNVVGGETPGSGNIISGNMDFGIHITDSDTSDNRVAGNYIGTDVTGRVPLGNIWGVQISFGAHDNTIGGETAGARNIISGNEQVGVVLRNVGTTGNHVQGNYIGTDVTGMTPLGNIWGVTIVLGAQDNVVGGESQDERNVISGNSQVGIQLQDDGTSGNQVQGNYIGTDATGTAQLGNTVSGVVIGFRAQNNVIGGETTGARNIISGNTNQGIWLQNEGTDNNKVWGNYIGTDFTGTVAISNRRGVGIGHGAKNNAIGGETAGARNIISGNAEIGVWLQDGGTVGNHVLGNYIGTDVTGMMALGNGVNGVAIGFAAHGNIIGGQTTGARNVISGNAETGVWLQDGDTASNHVLGNYIGTDATGSQALGNTLAGVQLLGGANENVIGVNNTIAYNSSAGVIVQDAATLRNTITRNIIHSNGGLPIDFIDAPLPFPPPSLVYSPLDSILSGSTCNFCRVEIFANSSVELAGTIFLDEVTTDAGGDFTIIMTVPATLPCLSVTVTDVDGTTSEFNSVPRSCYSLYLPAIMN